MDSIISFLLGLFQHCICCGNPVFKRQVQCHRCLQITLAEIQFDEDPTPRVWGQFPLLVLGSYQSENLAFWVKALKGAQRKIDYSRVADLWLQRRALAQSMAGEEVWVVPAPCRRRQGHDHAFYLGEAVAQKMGWHLAYEWPPPSEEALAQKRLSKKDRAKKKWRWQGEKPCSHHRIIFVDDVLTTGSTAEGVWKALGEPPIFEIWCMAYQPRLAGKMEV